MSTEEQREGIRLNKFIANAGVCSRREADKLIEAGLIKIDGKVVKEMGYKVQYGERVEYKGELLSTEKKVYILLNKPKDFLTTVSDDRGRKTVMDLLKNAAKERLYPVGRLDRNTTGVLLMTNDGELAQRLAHPSYNIKKVYHAVLDKKLSHEDFLKLQQPIELEDGTITLDDIDYVEGEGKTHIGVEIHSGKNRIVRRIFEHFNYEVVRLDRVMFAGFTKKDIPRGKYRFLTEKELIPFRKKDKKGKPKSGNNKKRKKK